MIHTRNDRETGTEVRIQRLSHGLFFLCSSCYTGCTYVIRVTACMCLLHHFCVGFVPFLLRVGLPCSALSAA